MQQISETERQDLIDAGLGADRLRTDPAFQRAVTEIRKNAVDALIGLNEGTPTYEADNRRLRAEIHAIDALCGSIAMSIQRGNAVRKNQAN
jgi:hypothetical protein